MAQHEIKIDRQKIRSLYEEGYSVQEIISIIGTGTIKYVRDLLRAMGYKVEEKNNLDIPKVKALLDAGWSIEKIVDEFNGNFTAEEIVNELKRREIR